MVKPVPPSGGAGPLADFQGALKALREQAGLSLRQMAMKVGVHHSTLARVVEPGRLPPRAAVLAFVEACRGDPVWWSRQYRDLLAARRTGRAVRFYPYEGAEGAPVEPAEDDPVGAARAFAGDMRYLWRRSGLTLARIAERSRVLAEDGRIARSVSVSAVSDLCNPSHGRVPQQATVEAFLFALGLAAEEIESWRGKHLQLVLGEKDLTPLVHSMVDQLRRTHLTTLAQGSYARQTGLKTANDRDFAIWRSLLELAENRVVSDLESIPKWLSKRRGGPKDSGPVKQWLYTMHTANYPLTSE